MQNLKQQYNKTLKRYYNGCNYLFNNPQDSDKYMTAVTKLLDQLNQILRFVPATKEEILNGFET